MAKRRDLGMPAGMVGSGSVTVKGGNFTTREGKAAIAPMAVYYRQGTRAQDIIMLTNVAAFWRVFDGQDGVARCGYVVADQSVHDLMLSIEVLSLSHPFWMNNREFAAEVRDKHPVLILMSRQSLTTTNLPHLTEDELRFLKTYGGPSGLLACRILLTIEGYLTKRRPHPVGVKVSNG